MPLDIQISFVMLAIAVGQFIAKFLGNDVFENDVPVNFKTII